MVIWRSVLRFTDDDNYCIMFRYDLIASAMEKEPNKFLLVHLLAKRMHQLADGAQPQLPTPLSSHFNTALQEFLEGLVEFKETPREFEK